MTDELQPNEVIIMKTPNWADLPEPAVPYFVTTRDGFYIRKKTMFGEASVPYKGIPESLVKPETRGQFIQNDLRFPMWLVMQATDFFTKVFQRHRTEAAIIVTYNPVQNEFRVFVPEQYVSHGGVHQRYDPEQLEPGWYAVGTIHSHCDFGAFHSGTDTHDADEMDGMHMTIGMLTKPNGPQVATMISMNKTLFHIKFEEGCDKENRRPGKGEEAPEWWFNHLKLNQSAPWLRKESQFHPRQEEWAWKQPVEPPKPKPVESKNPNAVGFVRRAQAWQQDRWEAWWGRKLAGSETKIAKTEAADGPFEKNAHIIKNADRYLEAAVKILEDAGFEINYTIVWRGKPTEKGK